MDPRPAIIPERLSTVKQIVAVSGGKGGIGKSVVSAVLALVLARKGCRIGLLDLDFTSPSAHLILGAGDARPVEDHGIVPPLVHGIRFLSISQYAADTPSPMRGVDMTNAILELLAITRWGDLDMLVIDMPPGIGDTALDTVRLLKSARFLIVTTPSALSLESVTKTVAVLDRLGVPMLGLVENMKRPVDGKVSSVPGKIHIPYLGAVRYDEGLEAALGNADSLLATQVAKDLVSIVAVTPAFCSDHSPGAD